MESAGRRGRHECQTLGSPLSVLSSWLALIEALRTGGTRDLTELEVRLHDARLASGASCAVELVEYLDRLDTLYEVARQRQERGKWGGVMPKRFDSTVITRLILAAPRESQEAVVWESRHCGLEHVRCPLVVMSTLCCLLAQESFRASGGESHSDG